MMASPQNAPVETPTTARHRVRAPRRLQAVTGHAPTRLCRCGASTTDYLCPHCTATLEVQVAGLPAKIRDLATTATRMSRLDGVGAPLIAGRSDRECEHALPNGDVCGCRLELPSSLPAALRTSMSVIALVVTPWPYAPDAAQLLRDTRRGLTEWATWVTGLKGAQRLPQHRAGPIFDRWSNAAEGPVCSDRYCAHRSCQGIRRQPPRDPDVDAAIAILRNRHLIPLDPRAVELARSVESMDWHLDDARDRREPDVYAGRCDADNVVTDVVGDKIHTHTERCGAHLYRRLEDDVVKCRQCGGQHDAAELKAKLRAVVDDEWARPVTIAAALTSLDAPVLVDTIYKWIERAKTRRDGVKWPDGTDLSKVKGPWKVPPARPRPGDFFQVGIDDDGRALYRVGDVRARVRPTDPTE